MISNDNYAKIEDLPGFVKDLQTNAILNVDSEQLLVYKQKKLQQMRIDALSNQINNMNIEIENIKAALQQITKKLSDN